MNIKEIALSVVIVFIILFSIIGIYTYFYQGRVTNFAEKCSAEGGHLYSGVENRVYCISDDGRWIEIYP